jgi:hypothetical protein
LTTQNKIVPRWDDFIIRRANAVRPYEKDEGAVWRVVEGADPYEGERGAGKKTLPFGVVLRAANPKYQ